MNKRILSMLLVALMAIALVVGAVSVSAADDNEIGTDSDSVEGRSIKEAAKTHKSIYLKGDYTNEAGVTGLNHSIDVDLNDYQITKTVKIYNDNNDKSDRDVYVSFTNSEGHDKNVIDIPSIIINNEAATNRTYELTVDDVYVPTITVKHKASLIVKNMPKLDDKAQADIKVVDGVNPTITVESGFVDEITGDGTGTVYIKDGEVNTIKGFDKVVVSGGKVLTAIQDVDDLEVTGGYVESVSDIEHATVNGGTVNYVGKNVELVLTKGAVGSIVDDASAVVYVKSAEIAGHVDANGKNITDQQARITGIIGAKAKVTVVRGYVSNYTGNSIERVLKCAPEYGSVALYHDVYVQVTDKKQELMATTEYVIDDKLIEKHVLDTYSGFEKITAEGKNTNKKYSGNDWVVLYANEHCDLNLTATGPKNYVITDTLYPLKDSEVYVNGLLLGSNLQPGAVLDHSFIYDKLPAYTYTDDEVFQGVSYDKFVIDGSPRYEPAHKWATELTKKTEAGTVTCDKERVLQDYFADTLNAGYYAKPDENGKIERQYNTDVEKDGAVIGSGHILTYHPYVAASEGKDGNDAYYTCDNCSKYFSKDIAVVYKGSVGVKAASEYEIPGVPTIKADPKETKAPETTAAPAETTAAPAETTKAPAETTAAPAETTAAPETQAPKPVTPSETGDNGMNALVWVIVLGAAVAGVAVASKSVLASKKH